MLTKFYQKVNVVQNITENTTEISLKENEGWNSGVPFGHAGTVGVRCDQHTDQCVIKWSRKLGAVMTLLSSGFYQDFKKYILEDKL